MGATNGFSSKDEGIWPVASGGNLVDIVPNMLAVQGYQQDEAKRLISSTSIRNDQGKGHLELI